MDTHKLCEHLACTVRQNNPVYERGLIWWGKYSAFMSRNSGSSKHRFSAES